MWYSYKEENYSIGYAESKDGIKWNRKDDIYGISSKKYNIEEINIQLFFSIIIKNICYTR